jgi:uncharacterized membrane protein (DUF485 family)
VNDKDCRLIGVIFMMKLVKNFYSLATPLSSLSVSWGWLPAVIQFSKNFNCHGLGIILTIYTISVILIT